MISFFKNLLLFFLVYCILFIAIDLSDITEGWKIEHHKRLVGISSVIFVVFLNIYHSFFLNKKFCAWCGSTKVKFISGSEGDWFWKHRNKDRDQDKRFYTNFEIANYVSLFECSKCTATTEFLHRSSKKPSLKSKIWQRKLKNQGNGERKATDFYGVDPNIPTT